MPRSSQTQLAVLGALAVEPATGYGVRQSIIETLGHFWHESFGQIYPTLALLEEEGLVTRDTEGRFAITREGRARLRALLAEPPEPVRPRNGLLLRLFFAAHFPAEEARRMVMEAREEAERSLERYQAIEQEILADGHPEAANWLTTVRFGIHHARATLAWAKQTLATLEDAQTAKPKRKRARSVTRKPAPPTK